MICSTVIDEALSLPGCERCPATPTTSMNAADVLAPTEIWRSRALQDRTVLSGQLHHATDARLATPRNPEGC